MVHTNTMIAASRSLRPQPQVAQVKDNPMGQQRNNPKIALRTKNALLASAGFGVFATAALAQVAAPDAPLKMQTDYFGYAASVLCARGIPTISTCNAMR